MSALHTAQAAGTGESFHCVDDLQFEVDFETADQAFDTQERVAEFARRQAPRIIDEVFSSCSHPGQVWRLPRLDVDLGSVPHDELEPQWEARLRERLAEALQAQQSIARGEALSGELLSQDELHSHDDGDEPPAGRWRSRGEAQLDTLLYFLRHGRLPWHAPQHLALASPLGQLAHEVLRDNAVALVGAWRTHPAAHLMVQRAVRQFSPAWLARLAAALAQALGAGAAAGWGREAAAWVGGFLSLWSASSLRPMPAEHLIWQGLLTALWSDAARLLDRSEPLQSMVQTLAPSPAEQAAIWRALQAVARRSLDGGAAAFTDALPGHALLHACMAARVPALSHANTADDQPDAAPGSRSEEQARLLQRLQAWMPPNAHDDDPAPWHELLRAEPSWARQALLQLGRSTAARQRMAQALPPAMLASLMALWLGPTDEALLLAATSDAALWGPTSAPADPVQRWEFSLAHVLLHPAPALFSGAEYLDTVLARRSEREHRPMDALLRDIEHRWRGSAHQASAPPAMQAWLRTRLPAEGAEGDLAQQRRARLEAALAEGVLAGAEGDWTDALATDAAWLQDLLRRTGRRPSLLRRMAREWPRPARTQLVGLWLLAPERTAVLSAVEDPAFAPLAGAGHAQPALALWEDLIAHLLRLTPGSFFNVDAYLRSLRERLESSRPKASHPPALPEPAETGLPGEETLSLASLSPSERFMLQQEVQLVLVAAQRAGLPAGDIALTRLAWSHVRHELVDEGRRYEPVSFPVRLARRLVEALRLPELHSWLSRMAADIGRKEQPTSATRIAEALRADAAALPASARPASEGRSKPPHPLPAPPPPAPLRFEDLAPRETLPAAHAGLVLTGAYLPRLFAMLGLTRDEAFVSPEAAERAVHLLHHLSTGEGIAPEPQLVIHKLLCGLDFSTPVLSTLALTPAETGAADGLLQAMISHWKVIGQTSVAGLRESFLQRGGRLTLRDDGDEGWQLKVEPRSYDMLLDHLPWGYSLQKFPWMKRPLHVEWR